MDTLFAATEIPLPAVSIDDQITCVAREIGMRELVYQRRVLNHQMTQKTADREQHHMRAVLKTLQTLKENGSA